MGSNDLFKSFPPHTSLWFLEEINSWKHSCHRGPAKITPSNRPAALHLTAEERDVAGGAEAFTGPASAHSSWPADPGPFWPLSNRQSLRRCSCPPRTAAPETRGGDSEPSSALLRPPPPSSSSCPHWWVSLPWRRRVVGGQRNASICQKRLMSVYCFLATTCITKEVQTSRLKLGFNWFVRCWAYFYSPCWGL